MVILLGCTGEVPDSYDIIGTWVANNGAVFQFDKEGAFSTKNLPGDKMFQYVEQYKEMRFNETGNWKIGEDQERKVIFINFDKSDNLPKGYSTQILISGSKGILENKPPWYLFLWEGEEGGSRYIFSKKE